jgi:hypothetical protein
MANLLIPPAGEGSFGHAIIFFALPIVKILGRERRAASHRGSWNAQSLGSLCEWREAAVRWQRHWCRLLEVVLNLRAAASGRCFASCRSRHSRAAAQQKAEVAPSSVPLVPRSYRLSLDPRRVGPHTSTCGGLWDWSGSTSAPLGPRPASAWKGNPRLRTARCSRAGVMRRRPIPLGGSNNRVSQFFASLSPARSMSRRCSRVWQYSIEELGPNAPKIRHDPVVVTRPRRIHFLIRVRPAERSAANA